MYSEIGKYWMNFAKQNTAPVHMFKYEDLILNKEKEMTDLFEFILAQESLEGTYA